VREQSVTFLPTKGAIDAKHTGIVFTRGRFLGFSRPTVATRCTDQGEIWQGGADRIGSGVWVYGPQNLKKWNFTFYQYNCS